MRRLFPALAVLLLTTSVAAHGGRHDGNLNISFDDSGQTEAAGCSGLSVRMDGASVPVVAEEVPFHGSLLRIRTARDGGGIRVVGTSGNSYGVTVCKAAPPGVSLAAVRTILAGNELSAEGPEGGRWVAYFLVRAPRGASLQLDAENGPISILDFNGTLEAEAENGPISVKRSSGSITARTTNGPVSIAGGSGNVRLDAANGPVSVKLEETTWDGNLDASTRNGPVTLKLPRGFRSGVLVEARGHGPVSCRAEGCPERQMRSDHHSDEPRRIELGSGPQVVRLSTTNGPISVREND